MDVGNFFRHLCELVLRHQMRVSNYFVNSFYSAPWEDGRLYLCPAMLDTVTDSVI
jgi:hypothetical protein